MFYTLIKTNKLIDRWPSLCMHMYANRCARIICVYGEGNGSINIIRMDVTVMLCQ